MLATATVLPTPPPGPVSVSASFVYDGDGRRVAQTVNGVTTYFVGAHYEYNQTSNQVTKYYFAGTTRIAMRKYTVPQSMSVEYFLGDHLGSTSITTDANGAKVSEMRYKPWGEVRYSWTASQSTTPAYELTKYQFTGQYSYMDDSTTGGTEGFGLMFYVSRLYDPGLGRFIQADSIVPGMFNPQSLNRYSYVLNSPINANDPSGHQCVGEPEECLDSDGNIINGGGSIPGGNNNSPINDPDWGENDDREERAGIVWNAICHSGGWWGDGCPRLQQLLSWLLYEEGGTLPYGDQVNMGRGMRYAFAYFGNTEESLIVQLAGYTAFFNPDGDGDFDQSDWDTITNPQYDFSGTTSIMEDIFNSDIKATDGNYLYWWDENEIKTKNRSQWPGKLNVDYFQTTTVKGLPFYFTGIPNIRNCAMYENNCR